MATLSLCMIVKNEEMNIARCLNSVANLVDDIVIVDTGSTDRTIEISTIKAGTVTGYGYCYDEISHFF